MKKFAFLIHPRASLREDMGKVFPLFKFLPEKFLEWMVKCLNPMARGKIIFSGSKEVAGWIIVVPLSARQFFSLPRDFVVKKIIKAVEMAKKMGVEVVGLGELTSPVTHGGENLKAKIDGVAITTGNSLTAAIAVKVIEKINNIRSLDIVKEKIAIIGAGGSVGKGASFLLAQKGASLILVEKEEKIEALKKIFSSYANVRVEKDISFIKEAEIVVVTTSSTEQIIKSDYLKQGAIVYDITQPRNTSPDILTERKDVTIIDGGVIDTPKIDYGMNIGLKKNQAYACLVETMICAMEGDGESHTGYTTPESARKMFSLMGKYQDYFKINISQSFGKSL
ncbi:MAG: shikimate dehydrogenase [Candidatus Nealsonbacteria bacterium CG23_combo_of_CG06-09_8_20_14_all_39_17]|uniref:Shikimate dehydrogenase n=1 Tax=Candidatus Nealsonbacteria bacterium CG23_combo_of_CG06-09_8_20_14_all_39_17 TaxID=1974722 RepID=A0A2G9YU80_9BACT|nr:MAG: shikimate dehydrogenase [Candidatus Nealsonbacteria bacterium CG23_combo_of_CG06-09_8_20_14_all_39_17]PIU43745.1 MAG: shikimate dehydrogenase [Candidatus Nealsonbacteria bacterium CG07_land_8_20_14_0_80_39_13]